jgi:hypothetical protein
METGDELGAEDYWHLFRGDDRRMTRKEFMRGYRWAHEDAEKETINKTFKHGDRNGDGELNRREFTKLFHELQEENNHSDSGSDHHSDSDSDHHEDDDFHPDEFWFTYMGDDGEMSMDALAEGWK